MPEYLAPGVYVEEVSFRAKSIEGVSTSTCAFVGPTRKGPYNVTPELVTSFGEYQRVYGGLADLAFGGKSFPNYMAHGARAFFDNGGRRLYVARTYVPAEDGGAARPGFAYSDIGGDVARIQARYAGSGYNASAEVYLNAKRVSGAIPLDKAGDGSLLRVTGGSGTGVALPARIDGTIKPPFALTNDDQLTFFINEGAPQAVTFSDQKQPAQVQSTEELGAAIDIPDDTSLTVQVGPGGALFDQQITLPSGGGQTPARLAAFLNLAIDNVKVGVDGNRLFIRTDERGDSAQLTISALPQLNLEAGTVHGTGNVDAIGSVSVEEINSALVKAGIAARATTLTPTGTMRIATVAVGAGTTLRIEDSDAKTALGLGGAPQPGQDGLTYTYYLKNGNVWTDAADAALDDQIDSRAYDLMTWTLEIQDDDGNQLIYDDLGFGAAHPNFIAKVLPEQPATTSEALQHPYYFAVTPGNTAFALFNALFGTESANTIAIKNGNDGVEPVPTTSSTSRDDHTVAFAEALEVLEALDDIAIVAAPGHSEMAQYAAIQQALISHAERDKYCIAVLDTPSQLSIQGARDARSRIDSSYAALYYPWVTVANPLWRPGNSNTSKEINVPPSGFIAGIYARTDINRGVWKPPANEVVRGAIRFERDINHAQQEVLNPEGVNCLRYFFGRGYRVWGARTASSDPEWKYVNIRRYFIYLEHSIDRSTQWAVFEPNGPRLWTNITDTVNAFLYNEWHSGALLGTAPEQAFFVRCDRSTMTQADLDNGRLICEVGVAAVKPAEFVIFRIGQKTADA
ncbi:phage tail sheath family protein [Desulfatitalea alkaliphila]|uniref:Phage tail sheath subtilisin-like domain-containing protein n=1 Tax=Desulfatitalea alkaliphila TaxID=2929485 RepID=A0AA41UJ19_9BACT|nr:phage tail sheath subtilisin-like domain-containing protein [Desulfatitalea alkaliphila]MCJ8500112.1 phage tail sheath subtilisin-like domain-containing protein [Desulfatitalea alkaliphila]